MVLSWLPKAGLQQRRIGHAQQASICSCGANTARPTCLAMAPPRIIAAMTSAAMDSNRSAPRAAQSPTLSPTKSAITAGFLEAQQGEGRGANRLWAPTALPLVSFNLLGAKLCNTAEHAGWSRPQKHRTRGRCQRCLPFLARLHACGFTVHTPSGCIPRTPTVDRTWGRPRECPPPLCPLGPPPHPPPW